MRRRRAFLAGCMVLIMASAGMAQELEWKASGRHGAVVGARKESTQAGMEILQAGGNAIDAAVATMIALSVTESEQFCFGSEAAILVYDARRNVVEAISAQGAAPRLATLAHFKARKGGIPDKGIEPATTPAMVDAWVTMLDRYGTMTFEQAAGPALRLLDRGEHEWHAALARTLRRLIAAEQTALGNRTRGLRQVADCFYRGPIAWELDAFSRRAGGLLRYADLATHVTRIEEPVSAEYRGHVVYKCGPWTQGPFLLQSLQVLEGFDLKAMEHHSAGAIHLIVEATKLGMADRDVHYGDPLFSRVPMRELLTPEYARLRQGLVDMGRASLRLQPGDPVAGKALREESSPPTQAPGASNDTTTCLVADRWGNVVAATPSGWEGVMDASTGIRLGTRLQSFNLQEGHPNCLEPGKRPRITLTPTLVMRQGKVVLAVSVAGGDTQDQASLQMVTDFIDFGKGADELVTSPYYTTNHFIGSFRQARPELGSLHLGDRIGPAVADQLRSLGHKVTVKKGPAPYDRTALQIDPATGLFHAAGDPERGRHADGF